jgi:hypothetical protein
MVLAFVVVVLVFTKACGNSDQYKALAAEAKSLREKVAKDSIERANERKQFITAKNEADGRRQLAEVEKSEADQKVSQQQRRIDQLTAIVRNAPATPPISGILVSAEYKAACDSLPNQIDKLNIALAEKDSAINDWSDILAYEVQIRDEEIFKEMQYSDSLKADFNRQTALLKTTLSTLRPRGKLLAGAGVIGNQTTFLSGAKVAIAYQTKTGKQYQAEAMIVRGEVYYGAGVMIQLFK